MNLKIKNLFAVIFYIVFLLSGCTEEKINNQEITTVKTFTAISKDYENFVSYSGYTSADELKRFSFELSGKINKILVEKGDAVKAGQIIATLDTETIQMAINNAKQDIANANQNINLAKNKISQIDSSINEINIGLEAERLTLQKAHTGIEAEKISLEKIKETYNSSISKIQLNYDNAKTTFENTQTLFSNGVCDKTTLDNAKLALDTIEEELTNTKNSMEKDISLQEKKIENLEQDYSLQEIKIKDMENKIEQANIQKQAAQISLEQAQISANQAQISLEQNTKHLNDSSLKSTIDGYVVETPMKSGEVTNAGNPVVVIKSGDEVVNIAIPTEDYTKLSVGMEAKLVQDDKETYGKISSIELYPDETTRTYNVKITPSENNSFALGSLVNVSISLDKQNSVFVPLSSIIDINGIDYVYCVSKNSNNENIVISKEIEILDADGENVCVKGIESGTIIVMDEVKNLHDNQIVNIKEGVSVEK